MGRVTRLTERRALRRAADLALLTSLGTAAQGRAGGAADQDFVYTRLEPAAPAAPAHVHDPVTEPIPIIGLAEFGPNPSDDHGWGDDDPPTSDVEVPAEPVDIYDMVADHSDDSERYDIGGHVTPIADSVPEPAVDNGWFERVDAAPPAPTPDHQPALRGEPVVSSPYVRPDLDFAVSGYPGRTPRYPTRPAAAVLVAAVIAAVVCGGWLLVRDPAVAVKQSSTESPRSAAPVPSKAPPVAVSALKPPPAPAPPPPPPPPPPAAQPTYSAPQRQYSPRYSESTPAQKPRVDVTRAPMSVAPVPRPVPGSDSNTPGDAPDRDHPRRRGCFGFC
jgi:hypothetical protein